MILVKRGIKVKAQGISNPLEDTKKSSKVTDPCVLVIFGATGDLTARKLMPAIYNLALDAQLPSHFACVGFARRQKTNEAFREEMHKAVSNFSRTKPLDEKLWSTFSNQLFYHVSNFDEDEGYIALKAMLEDLDQKLGTKGNRVYYLSIQPSFFPMVVQKLHKHGLIYNSQESKEKWSRIIIEKPFGHDLDSSIDLQNTLTEYLSENQIYRIDHYLGKETVQNLLVFRFANSIFESIWNNRYVDHVQITVAEELGIGSRGLFFEEAGILRDIVQNHMMQLLSLMAMEPPVSLNANDIRDEKVKVLRALRPIDMANFGKYVVRGQYGPGFIDGKPVCSYREEGNVSKSSSIETFVALQLFIDNWRWVGVPFFLRAGKRMPKRTTEIAITFKDVPGVLFQNDGAKNENNVLTMRIQPNEGISLKINSKVPGPSSPIQPVKMDYRYDSYFGVSPPEAYERLICDCMLGESTLFARVDEVEASWRLFTPVLERWKESSPSDFPNYSAGTWGPKAANDLISKEGRAWRIL
jgi:glucose-6-phosphate 1-dehydrogenase